VIGSGDVKVGSFDFQGRRCMLKSLTQTYRCLFVVGNEKCHSVVVIDIPPGAKPFIPTALTLDFSSAVAASFNEGLHSLALGCLFRR
jgi:hypothetical protein